MPWRFNPRAFSEGGAIFVFYPPKGRRNSLPFEYERLPEDGALELPLPSVECPRCGQRVPLQRSVCENCGFPFVCDTAPIRRRPDPQKLTLSWRTVLGTAILLFALTNAVTVSGSNIRYSGETNTVSAHLHPPTDNRIALSGPQSFVTRTQLALDLLAQRAPEFYLRMQENVKSIDYQQDPVLYTPQGKPISLEGMGAVSEPETREVHVLLGSAFPSGVDEFWDYDVFTYAGTLVHELRHIELHYDGSAPGGWQEELLCEKAAYSALSQAGAPAGVLAHYEVYFDNPQAKRYQRWYDWYKQW